ncbi:MAG TPA: hypothetical protein VH393_09535 [Ktedonobacterales bacterium]|jgi:hypothetical protein
MSKTVAGRLPPLNAASTGTAPNNASANDVAEADLDNLGTTGGTAVIFGPSVPLVTLALSVILILLTTEPARGAALLSLWEITVWLPVLISVVVTLAFWWLAARLFRGLSAPTNADRRNYIIARKFLSEIQLRLGVDDTLTDSVTALSVPSGTNTHASAYQAALRARNMAVALLKRRGLCWSLADGYIALYRYLHSADQALILCSPRDTVIDRALTNELRFEDSTIPHREHLLDQLRRAVLRLDPAAAFYLDKGPPSLSSQNANAISTEQAYAMVGDTQRELDNYVEDRFEGIITVRNRLMAVHALTGVVTYVAFLFALAVGISSGALQDMAALFLVGALASMLNWYTLIVGSDNALPDYGLSLTRLFAAPLLSGLVALAAVLLLQSLTGSLASHAPNTLEDLFALDLKNVVIAAAFGFTPSLIITLVQKQTDRYMSEIKSTEATGVASK